MKAQRVITVLLIVVQAAILAIMLHDVALLALILALVGVWGRFQVDMTRERKIIVAVALAFALTVQWRLFLYGRGTASVALGDGFGVALARYGLLLQALLLFVRTEDRLPATIPLYGAVVLTCAGDVTPRGFYWGAYAAAVAAFIVLAAAFYVCGLRPRAPSRPRGRAYLAVNAVVVALSLALGGGVAASLKYQQRRIDTAFERLVSWPLPSNRVGFSGRGVLGSVARMRSTEGTRVALRVRADTCPGYLRGKAFDTYGAARWTNAAEATPLRPERRAAPPPGLELAPGEQFFRMPGTTGPAVRHLRVRPTADPHGMLFTPLGTTGVAAPLSVLQYDDNGNVLAGAAHVGMAYGVAAGRPAAGAHPGVDGLARLTALPEDLDPRIRTLARQVFAGRTATRAKIAAVVGHFAANYTYQLGISVPAGEDPLTYFLLEQPPAHCEYFASGAALLLRVAGVPCRYVTGFVACEKNAVGDYWIARNSDAHAWVEAYDPATGWSTVEATVADGVPAPGDDEEGGGLSHLWDFVRTALGDVQRDIRNRDFPAALARTVAFAAVLLKTLPGTVIVAGLALLALRAVVRPLLRRRARRPRRPPVEPVVGALQRLLRRVETGLRKRDVRREPNETLHQFAARIVAEHPEETVMSDAAGWFQDYADLRYGGAVNRDAVAALQARIEAWRSRR